MISFERQTFQQFEFLKLMWRFIILLRLEKCLEKFLMPFFWADFVRKWGNKFRTARTFSCAINTQLLARIVAFPAVFQHFFSRRATISQSPPFFCFILFCFLFELIQELQQITFSTLYHRLISKRATNNKSAREIAHLDWIGRGDPSENELFPASWRYMTSTITTTTTARNLEHGER
jgi:hypothetical protein